VARPQLHPLHLLWRLLPAEARRRWLAGGTALLAPSPDRDPPVVPGGMAVAGELGRASGLGESARLFLAGLAHLDVTTWPLPVDAPLLARPGAAGGVPPAGVPLLLHVNSPQTPLALLRLPRRLMRGRRIIGHWYWELPTVPDEWHAGIPFVHEVWTPSHFTCAALEPLLPGRVHRVPVPLALRPPQPAALDRAAFGLPEDAVIVLVSFSLASSFVRKNPLGAIAAFRDAFAERPDRLLLLKVSNTGHFPDDFAQLRAAIGDARNIRLETRTLPAADSFALTRCSDIVLSLHRSEGFGLVPAEAMLLGRAVVATGWSGNMDFMDAASAALVGYRLVPARDPRGVFQAPGAEWAEADLGEAAAQLRRLADDASARTALGAAGQAHATRCLGPEPLAAALRRIGVLGRA
jgi:glycosyltransferase involved in cell wall biosynthesis